MHSRDVQHMIKNLASNAPLARLRALQELGALLRGAFDDLVDAAQLEQVRAARERRAGGDWRSIGDALGVSATQAHRRFAKRL